MAISDRINEMYTHIGDVYDTITNVDLPTNKNIQNIPSTMRSSYLEIMNNGIDKIWNNWEKVEGEGETLTLNSTEEAPMKINLKGNTSQETTTGKNLLNIANLTATTKNGITLTKNNDGTITLNGTASGDANFVFAIDNITATSDYKAQIYKQSGSFTNNYVSLYLSIDSAFSSFDLLSMTSSDMIQMSLGNKTYTHAQVKVNGGVVCNNLKIGVQVVNRTTNTFEPYTNGASPNPEYPQDIHVVSGDNSIDVCGKNLFDKNAIVNQSMYAGSVGQVVSIGTNTNTFRYPIFKKTSNSITISASDTSAIMRVLLLDNDNKILSTTAYTTLPQTIDTSSCEYIAIFFDNTTITINDNIQIEKGNSVSEFQPYQSQSYPINLGVENLVNPSLFTINGSDKVASIINGEVTSSSLSGYAGARIELGQNINLKTNDVIYVRLKIKSDVAGDIFNTIQLFNSSNAVITYTPTKLLTPTLTTEYQEYIMKYVLGIDDVLRRLYIQHKGSSSNVFTIKDIQVSYVNGSYTPYGTTPIELCKIGDYQDSIKKSTGKNLFDKNNANVLNGMFINASAGNIGSNANATSIYIPINPNTTYCVSKTKGNRFAIGYSSTTPAVNVSLTNIVDDRTKTSLTSTSSSDSKYLVIYISLSDTETYENIISTIQIEYGNTPTDFEPYGKVWYLNKQIGKKVFVGTENWTYVERFPRFYINLSPTPLNNSNLFCSHYIKGQTADTDYVCSLASGTGYSQFLVHDERFSTKETYNTWLSSNNVTLYYALQTPTTTEITDSTLLSQLEAFYNAKSKNSQTNISQENNDLPFILDATALKQLN